MSANVADAQVGLAFSQKLNIHTIPSEVVQRFALKNGLQHHQADSLFVQLETFLGSASNTDLEPTQEIDEAWHEFILHTELYEEYCFSKFGRFIHHIPQTPLDKNCQRKCTHPPCGTGGRLGRDKIVKSMPSVICSVY